MEGNETVESEEETALDNKMVVENAEERNEQEMNKSLEQLLQSERLLLDEETGSVYVVVDETDAPENMEVASYEEVSTNGGTDCCWNNNEEDVRLKDSESTTCMRKQPATTCHEEMKPSNTLQGHSVFHPTSIMDSTLPFPQPISAPKVIKPGVTIQEVCFTKEIEVSWFKKADKTGEPTPKVIKAGEQVAFIKTPKGCYIRTPDGEYGKYRLKSKVNTTSLADTSGVTNTSQADDNQADLSESTYPGQGELTANRPSVTPNKKQEDTSRTLQPGLEGKPYVEILEQPKSSFRFRTTDPCNFPTSCIFGEHYIGVVKTYPTIKVHNHRRQAVIVVSCVSDKEPYKPHSNTLVGKDCRKGVCTKKVLDASRIELSNFCIRRAKKKDVEENLKMREMIRVDPFRTGFSHKGADMDLNCVRLCFQVFLPDECGMFRRIVRPVVSRPIHNMDTHLRRDSAEKCVESTSSSGVTSEHLIGSDEKKDKEGKEQPPYSPQEVSQAAQIQEAKGKLPIVYIAKESSDSQNIRGKFTALMTHALCRLSSEMEAIPFRYTVRDIDSIDKDYSEIIKRPIDFNTILMRLESYEYEDPWHVVDDLWCLFENTWTYYKKPSRLYRFCTQLAKKATEAFNSIMTLLGYCCGVKYAFKPKLLNCQRKENCIIDREEVFYSFPDGTTFCENCFHSWKYESFGPKSIEKESFCKKKNIFLEHEPFVSCEVCKRKFHKVCVLHLETIWTEGFVCENCLKEKGLKRKKNIYTAKRLPRCQLSNFLEDDVNTMLSKKSSGNPQSICIRVLSSQDKVVEVQPKMKARYVDSGEMVESFPYRAKSIFAFTEIDGVDVCFFGMFVQEYGSDCPHPNTRRVHISYIDSVHFFKPYYLRTAVYVTLVNSYLKYVRQRGYLYAHIWACPPRSHENDFIFYCHPLEQRIPKQRRLEDWYRRLLDRAIIDWIVIDYETLFKYCRIHKISSAKDLPYLEEDFLPGYLEETIKELDEKKSDAEKENKDMTDKAGNTSHSDEHGEQDHEVLLDKANKESEGMTDKTENESEDISDEAENGSENMSDKVEKVKKDMSDAPQKMSEDMSDTAEKVSDDKSDAAEKVSEDMSDTAEMSEDMSDEAEKVSEDMSDTAEIVSEDKSDAAEKVSEDMSDEADKGSELILDKTEKEIECMQIGGAGSGGILTKNDKKGDDKVIGESDAASKIKRRKLSKEYKVNGAEDQKLKQTTGRKGSEILSHREDDLSEKLFAFMKDTKELFFVVHLQRPEEVATLPPTHDPDPLITNKLAESRETFLAFAEENNLEFSSLRRAKFSTLCFLYKFHKERKEMVCDECRSLLDVSYWFCPVCDDFSLCDDCFRPENHQHSMVHLNSAAFKRSSSTDSQQAQETKKFSVTKSVDLLVHACQCKDANCRLQNCQHMQHCVLHARSCRKKIESKCRLCEQLFALSMSHAKHCKEIMCHVIFCSQLKQKCGIQTKT